MSYFPSRFLAYTDPLGEEHRRYSFAGIDKNYCPVENGFSVQSEPDLLSS